MGGFFLGLCFSIGQRGPKSQAAELLWFSKLRDCKRDSDGDLKDSHSPMGKQRYSMAGYARVNCMHFERGRRTLGILFAFGTSPGSSPRIIEYCDCRLPVNVHGGDVEVWQVYLRSLNIS